jgi:hypothetical protein
MRNEGKLKLGFYPLPTAEAARLRKYLLFRESFSAIDPCVGDGVAFSALVGGGKGYLYGAEIDANRAGQAQMLGIQTIQANILDVRCPAESSSLLYLNPPYDFEAGASGNQRLERVFLEHTYRWLKPKGILIFVISQAQLHNCSRLLAEYFDNLRVYRLTEPACIQYKQIVVLGSRRKRNERMTDSLLINATRYLEGLSVRRDLASLTDEPDGLYDVPLGQPATLTNLGISLDEVENILPGSAAYRQASRVILRGPSSFRGRPLTPLHGGHVGLLCTAGMLNGVFGEGEERHIAHWRSVKFTDHWQEEEPDGTVLIHDRERFSHELTLIFSCGKTQILTHEKSDST